MRPEDIKKIRQELSISQEGLARLVGVSAHTLNRWERGKSKPSPMAIENLKRISVKKEGSDHGQY